MKNVTKALTLVFVAILVSWNANVLFAQKPIDIVTPDDTSDMYPPWDYPQIDKSIPVKECMSKAKKGDADAQIELALRYFKGNGVKQSEEKALKLAMKSAKQGNGKALYFLAFIENDLHKTDLAKSLLKLAAEKGYVLAETRMGIIKFSEGDYAQSYQWHLKAAKHGNIQSCYECGVYLLMGDGVEQDLEEAVRWFRIAAEGGHIRAQYELGICYANGEGVDQDYKESAKWITKSAEQNHPRSLFLIGVYYIKGIGVAPDYQKGINYIIKASVHGSKDANEFLKQLQNENNDKKDFVPVPNEQKQKAFG